MSDFDIFDIAIIGTGPAGISAAITASVRKQRILLLGDENLSDKILKAHSILNYPGLPNITGIKLANSFKNHLDSMNIKITSGVANMVYDMGGEFAIVSGQEIYKATSIIIATGMASKKPFEKEIELLGRGISYCATCDAALYNEKTAIVISYGKKEEAEAVFLADYADKVIYIPMYDFTDFDDNKNANKISVVKTSSISILDKDNKAIGLRIDDGDIFADGIFILRDSIAPNTFLPDLKMNENHIDVNASMETNIKGVYAAGDVTGIPYQYVKAAGEGNIAALSAANYVSKLKISSK